MTYQDAQPWAVAIKAAVLSRRMPLWGAVKGFGDFRNDQGLAQNEMDLISDWVDGGIRRGNNPNVLPDSKIRTGSCFQESQRRNSGKRRFRPQSPSFTGWVVT
jgi:hypothetical protein